MEETELFWRDCNYMFPNLSMLAKLCLTLAASSGAAERVFSRLKHSFSLSQINASLSDYTEASIMLQMNNDDF